jgi:hypothetical protein
MGTTRPEEGMQFAARLFGGRTAEAPHFRSRLRAPGLSAAGAALVAASVCAEGNRHGRGQCWNALHNLRRSADVLGQFPSGLNREGFPNRAGQHVADDKRGARHAAATARRIGPHT